MSKETTIKALLPKLRFTEFMDMGKWEKKLVEEYFNVGSSKRVLQKDWVNDGVPFYRTRELVSLSKNESFCRAIYISEELFLELSEKYGVPTKGDFLVSGVGTIGVSYQVKSGDKFYFKDGNVLWFKLLQGLVSDYFKYCLQSQIIQSQILGKASFSTVGTYTIQNAKKTEFWLAYSPDEQQKIADCLSSIDDLITAQAKKIESLKDHKKGLMQQLFPAEGETVPQLRFPEFRDAREWDVKPLGDGFKRLTTKNSENNQNPLTISAQLGLVNQLEYFNKRIAANNLSGYYLLHKGDFAYNKSYSKGYPMGAIKPLKLYDKGVVSTLYICFRTKKGYNECFYEHYFESGLLDPEIGKIAQEGGRAHGLLNVSVKEFFKDVNIYVPWPKEQQKIADCLSSIDDLITAQAKKIESLKAHKKGLMQQLFPVDNEEYM